MGPTVLSDHNPDAGTCVFTSLRYLRIDVLYDFRSVDALNESGKPAETSSANDWLGNGLPSLQTAERAAAAHSLSNFLPRGEPACPGPSPCSVLTYLHVMLCLIECCQSQDPAFPYASELNVG